MNRSIPLVAAAAFGLLMASATCATPITFFGQDLNPGTSTTNSDTANSQFFSHLVAGTGTEDFEGFATGTAASLNVTFPGSLSTTITATLSGTNNEIKSGADGAGRFPTSLSKYLVADQDFQLTFSAPIAAFGFYGTDIGDFSGQLVLTLAGGGTSTLTIPTASGSSGSNSGNQIFWGFIDPTQTYTSISFSNTNSGIDFFGFDDMTIGDVRQVRINVPEPGQLGMFGLGALLLGTMVAVQRRRRRARG